VLVQYEWTFQDMYVSFPGGDPFHHTLSPVIELSGGEVSAVQLSVTG